MAIRLNDDLSNEDGELHEINVTPFIDVMLVLLIIFMVAAPLATVDIRVDLPSANSKPQTRPDKPLFVSLKANKQLYVGEQLVGLDNLAPALDSYAHGDKETTIFFQADKQVDYETIMTIMSTLRQAGYLKVGLVAAQSTVD